jgi:integrase
MALYKRGNVYWSYNRIDGVRYAKSTGTGNLRQAEQIDQRFRNELNLKRQGIRQLAPDKKFAELAALFLASGTPKPYHVDRLKLLLPYFGETPIGRINRGMTEDYRRHRHAEKNVTDTTVNRDLELLRHILYWAVDEGFLSANPISRMRLVTERRKPRLILSLADERLLLVAAAPHLRQIITIAVDTGMRRGEILNQQWEHIDFTRQLLYVTRSKTAGGESREIPLTDRVNDLLFNQRKEEGLLFTFQGKPIHAIRKAWTGAVRRAGIRYLRFHDLRHTFNSRLMESGVIQDVRKALMGHSMGEDINDRYTHVELPAKREAIRKLQSWVVTHNQEPQLKGESNERSEGSRTKSGKVIDFPDGKKALEEKDTGRGRS